MDDPRAGSSATLRRYATRIRHRGPLEVATEVAGAVRSSISSRGRLRFLTRGTLPSDVGLPDLTMRPAGAEDADRYARQVGTDSPHTFRRRLGPGTDCYLALDGQRIVHSSWVTTAGAWVGELRLYFVVPLASAYVYESYTSPDARGRGIYPAMLRYIASDAARDAPKELWIGVGEDNEPSIRAISKGGFVPAFDVAFSRRLGRVEVESIAGPRSDEAAQVLSRDWPPGPMVR
ncbi:MAG: GNAT family N-acetyltransferase [Actinobacteria bacterium]|nr:GNAT family N-acetyltransferase [Actinomycetota bacterium]